MSSHITNHKPHKGDTVTLVSFKTFAKITAAMVISYSSQAAFAQNFPVSANYLTGIWKENAQCLGGEAVVFFQNNTMSSSGSVPVNYTVTGSKQILMYGPGGAIPIEIDTINQNTIVLKFQGGATLVHRCGSGFNAPPQYNPNTANAGVSPAFIVGRWSHIGNCANPENFMPGGHFMTSTSQPGTWAVFGNTLRMTINNGAAIDFSVQIYGPNNMTLTQINKANNISNYTRC